jgi:hypothetical protein
MRRLAESVCVAAEEEFSRAPGWQHFGGGVKGCDDVKTESKTKSQ